MVARSDKLKLKPLYRALHPFVPVSNGFYKRMNTDEVLILKNSL